MIICSEPPLSKCSSYAGHRAEGPLTRQKGPLENWNRMVSFILYGRLVTLRPDIRARRDSQPPERCDFKSNQMCADWADGQADSLGLFRASDVGDVHPSLSCRSLLSRSLRSLPSLLSLTPLSLCLSFLRSLLYILSLSPVSLCRSLSLSLPFSPLSRTSVPFGTARRCSRQKFKP